MRPVRTITAAEENFRLEPIVGTPARLVARDFVAPEPVGTVVLKAFRITGYGRDCDGSALPVLVNIDGEGDETGWQETAVGIDDTSTVVATEAEWRAMFPKEKP